MFQTTLFLVLLLYPAYHFACLFRNYRVAQKTGLPIAINPFNPTNPLWFLISSPIHKLLSLMGLGSVLRLNHLGWEYEEKARPFIENCSSVIMQVTPASNWISLADPDAVAHVFQGERRGEFARPPESVKMMDVFGPNIMTVSRSSAWYEHTWCRH